ncbi:MAG: class I adenylate cyclase [Planctomycetes bacterium]|nr:class I adenylate cyclase [Planctomycetota bacterium]
MAEAKRNKSFPEPRIESSAEYRAIRKDNPSTTSLSIASRPSRKSEPVLRSLFDIFEAGAEEIDESAMIAEAQNLERSFITFNRLKLERIVGALDEEQRKAFVLIPSLLHYNDPDFFGADHARAPCGIHSFSEKKEASAARKEFFPRARNSASAQPPAIEFLTVMGSVGSIAQTRKSDLDFWVCLSEKVDGVGADLLGSKLREIESWAMSKFRLEVHFFITDVGKLRRDEYGEVDEEGCGTALAKLLKEEYYRTAVHMAGRRAMWTVAPVGASNARYEHLRDNFDRLGATLTENYVDIGHLGQISRGEFLGGSLWQQNKSLGSPFKSVLKMALLMQYFDDEAGEGLLADLLKSMISKRPFSTELSDPYILMFDRVESYYKVDSRRFGKIVTPSGSRRVDFLDLLRRCFFLKIMPDFYPDYFTSKQRTDRAAIVMMDYVQKWKFSYDKVVELRKFKQWNFAKLMALREEINAFMTSTFRFVAHAIERLESERGETARVVSERDELVLLNRLRVVYDFSKPGKVEYLQTPYRRRAMASSFSILERPLEDGSRWELYEGQRKSEETLRANASDLFENGLLRIESTLPELLAWMFQNELYSSNTSVSLYSKMSVVLEKNVSALMAKMWDYFGKIDVAKIEASKFGARPRKEKTLLAINLVTPADLPLPARFDMKDDPLNYGMEKATLIKNVSLFIRNSWGEFFTRTFEGENALENALLYYLDRDYLENAEPTIEVFCASGKLATPAIGKRVARIAEDMRFIFKEKNDEHARMKRFIMQSDDGLFVFRQEAGAVSYDCFFSMDEFLVETQNADCKLNYFDSRNPLGFVNPVLRDVRVGEISVISYESSEATGVVIVDETGSLFQIPVLPRNLPFYLKRLVVFLCHAANKVKFGNVDSPFSKVDAQDVVRIFKCRKAQAGQKEFEVANVTGSFITPQNLSLANEQKIEYHLDVGADGKVIERFVIGSARTKSQSGPVDHRKVVRLVRSDDSVFSSWEFEDELFDKVTLELMKRRVKGEHYPIYLTDIGFSKSFIALNGEDISHTGEMLKLKLFVEKRLVSTYRKLVAEMKRRTMANRKS